MILMILDNTKNNENGVERVLKGGTYEQHHALDRMLPCTRTRTKNGNGMMNITKE